MSSQNDLGFKTFVASGAISAYRAVDLQSDGTITACGNGVKGIGVTQEDVVDAGYANVKLWTAPGTHMVGVSGSAVTPGTDYSIITGGYAGAASGTVNPAYLTGLVAGVASNGIVIEFIQNDT